jgi:hypothetical protein
MNGRLGRKRRSPYLKQCPGIRPEGLKKTMKVLNIYIYETFPPRFETGPSWMQVTSFTL